MQNVVYGTCPIVIQNMNLSQRQIAQHEASALFLHCNFSSCEVQFFHLTRNPFVNGKDQMSLRFQQMSYPRKPSLQKIKEPGSPFIIVCG